MLMFSYGLIRKSESSSKMGEGEGYESISGFRIGCSRSG